MIPGLYYVDKSNNNQIKLLIDRYFLTKLNQTMGLYFKQVQNLDSYLLKSELLGSKVVKRLDHFAIITDGEDQTVVSDVPIVIDNGKFGGLFEKTKYRVVDLNNTELISERMRDMFLNCDSSEIHLTGMKVPMLKDVSYMLNMTDITQYKGPHVVTMDGIITKQVTKSDGMINTCINLKYLSMKDSDTSNIESMQFMFDDCTELEQIEGLENFTSTNLKNTYGMFNGCFALKNIDMSNFDMTTVQQYDSMFAYCAKLETIVFKKAITDKKELKYMLGNISKVKIISKT